MRNRHPSIEIRKQFRVACSQFRDRQVRMVCKLQSGVQGIRRVLVIVVRQEFGENLPACEVEVKLSVVSVFSSCMRELGEGLETYWYSIPAWKLGLLRVFVIWLAEYRPSSASLINP